MHTCRLPGPRHAPGCGVLRGLHDRRGRWQYGGMAKRGRPTKYRDDMPKRVEAAAEDHAPMTDEQIAELFGVDEKTVITWRKTYPEFLQSVKKAKAISDDKVEHSLFERATGYSVLDVHISTYEGEVIKTPIIKHYPPDPTSMIFWLKNRRPDEWRDQKQHDLNINKKLEDMTVEELEARLAELSNDD